ncbi:MAG: C40 family peptidase [Motilibacteraceae bacterium]
MARRALRRPTSTLVALSTAAVAALTLVPGTAVADPAPTIAQVQAQLDDLDHQAEVANEKVNGAQVQRAQIERELAKVRAQAAAQQKKLEAMRGEVASLAAASYRNGGIDPEVQLLLSDNPDEFLAGASSINQLAQRQATALRKVQAARNQLAQDNLAVAQRLGQLKTVEQQLQAQKAELDRKVAQSKALLSSLKAEQRRRLEEAQRAARARELAAARAARDSVRSVARTTSSSLSTSSGDSSPSAPVPVSGRASTAVSVALSKVGDAYVWGAAGPNVFDCSGLMMYAWRAAGVSLPHYTVAQYGAIRHVSLSQIQPGDLVFYYSGMSHVGMYIGGGQIVHAANPRSGVKISPLNEMPISGVGRP